MWLQTSKHQRREQTRIARDFCYKVHDRAKYIVLPSYTMHELRIENVCITQFHSQKQKTTIGVLCLAKAKKNEQKI